MSELYTDSSVKGMGAETALASALAAMVRLEEHVDRLSPAEVSLRNLALLERFLDARHALQRAAGVLNGDGVSLRDHAIDHGLAQ